jgi:hypothetical protein
MVVAQADHYNRRAAMRGSIGSGAMALTHQEVAELQQISQNPAAASHLLAQLQANHGHPAANPANPAAAVHGGDPADWAIILAAGPLGLQALAAVQAMKGSGVLPDRNACYGVVQNAQAIAQHFAGPVGQIVGGVVGPAACRIAF